jgi:hypothetical protein
MRALIFALLLCLSFSLWAAVPGALRVGWDIPLLDQAGDPVGDLKVFKLVMYDGTANTDDLVLTLWIPAASSSVQLVKLDTYLQSDDAYFEVTCIDVLDRESNAIGGGYDVGSIGVVLGSAPVMTGNLTFEEG